MSENEQTHTRFYETKAKEIMISLKSHFDFIDETTEMTTLLTHLKNTDHAWVMDSRDPLRLLGIITQSDILAFLSPPFSSDQSFEKPDSRSMQYGENITANDIMSKKPVTVSQDETIREILVKMKEQKIKHLPVITDHGHLIGEVSLFEIIKEYIQLFNQTLQGETLRKP